MNVKFKLIQTCVKTLNYRCSSKLNGINIKSAKTNILFCQQSATSSTFQGLSEMLNSHYLVPAQWVELGKCLVSMHVV